MADEKASIARKELSVIQNLLRDIDKHQDNQQPAFQQGLAFLQGLCSYDPAPFKTALDVEIKAIEA